jgi:uncharacterized protein YjbI with pentapeptide repeats
MASEEQLKIIRQGADVWNDWRDKRPELLNPDLREADLCAITLDGANLKGADLFMADLQGGKLRGANLQDAQLWVVDLREADLTGANLTAAYLEGTDFTEAKLCGANLTRARLIGAYLDRANLTGADFSGANLEGAQLIRTDLRNATLTGSYVYGVSVWDIKVDDRTKQQNLVITPPGAAVITVDNIKVAQFIYLLLNNEEIRDAIDTITSKAVLLLGRFSKNRKAVLDALRNALRIRGFLPIVFDFKRPKSRDFTETIMTLAGMACFIIADITNPKSAPLELKATVPNYMIPFIPILKEGELAFSMFSNLQTMYDWVFGTLKYDSIENLIKVLDDAVIDLALAKRHELEVRKAQSTPARHVSDYRNRPGLSHESGNSGSTRSRKAIKNTRRGSAQAPARMPPCVRAIPPTTAISVLR